METKINLETLKNVKLFDAERLRYHIEDRGCVLYLTRPQLAAWMKPHYTFSFTAPDCGLMEVSISEVMECLDENGIIEDSDIILEWEAHEEWYAKLLDAFGSLLRDLENYHVMLPFEVYPTSSFVDSSCIYGDDVTLIKFIELLLVMADVSVLTDSMESQQKIIGDAVSFTVNELIPALYSENKVSNETATALMQKVYEHISKLFWIYSLWA